MQGIIFKNNLLMVLFGEVVTPGILLKTTRNAFFMVNNLSTSARTKHIDIRDHFMCKHYTWDSEGWSPRKFSHVYNSPKNSWRAPYFTLFYLVFTCISTYSGYQYVIICGVWSMLLVAFITPVELSSKQVPKLNCRVTATPPSDELTSNFCWLN